MKTGSRPLRAWQAQPQNLGDVQLSAGSPKGIPHTFRGRERVSSWKRPPGGRALLEIEQCEL